ncbi:MAG: hypothetical protein AAGE52_14395 [Myxococcota bacterium]
MPQYDKAWLDETLAAMNASDEVDVEGRHPPKVDGWVEPEWYDSTVTNTQGPEWAALHAHLKAHRQRWLELPMTTELHWRGKFSEEGVGVCGGFCLRSLAEAWDARDYDGWQAPMKDPSHGAQLLLDFDNWHATGYTLVAVGEELELIYSDRHRFLPLTLDPLEYFEVALECLGWPGWQLLFAPPRSTDASLERTCFTPMEKYLTRWFPNRGRPKLSAALKIWRSLLSSA